MTAHLGDYVPETHSDESSDGRREEDAIENQVVEKTTISALLKWLDFEPQVVHRVGSVLFLS